MADMEAEKNRRVRPFGGLVVAADGGIKILIAFWRDFVKGRGQACGFSHSGQLMVDGPDRAESDWHGSPMGVGVGVGGVGVLHVLITTSNSNSDGLRQIIYVSE